MSNGVPLVTASMLYDLATCEHRPWMDLHADPALRDTISPFIQLLWARALAHEEEVMARYQEPYLNLQTANAAERERLTIEAMRRDETMIYGGRLSYNELLAEPALLRLENGKYVPGIIKSGSAEEGSDDADRKPKVHYGVQLALYVDVLEKLGFSDARHGFIWDIHGDEIYYDLTAPRGPRTPTSLWDEYLKFLATAHEIIAGTKSSTPAYFSACKQCWWNTACIQELEHTDDLTLIPELGRARRKSFLPHVKTVAALARSTTEQFLDTRGRSILAGVSPETITKFRARANLLAASHGTAYLKEPIQFPTYATELFFDIETDPMRDHCYLHGFVLRRNNEEAYHGFFSREPTPIGEREAFAKAWDFVHSQRPCAVYFYSPYERTWWRNLRERYTDICSETEMESLFADPAMTDLYEVVRSKTEWPTRDYSLKTLAKYLGFSWRDTHPSGAASIEWYDRYVTGDPDAKQRILEYNEDDCLATRVLLDGIRSLSLRGSVPLRSG
jgi:predicted RecB family nuclease